VYIQRLNNLQEKSLRVLISLIMGTTSLYVATVAIWGSSWYVIKLQLSEVPAEVSIFYRFAIAALILQLFCRLRGKPMSYSLPAHLLFAQMGLFLFFLNFLLIYYASYELTTGLVSVVFTLVLVFNMISSRVFLGDRISIVMCIGAVTGFIGIVLVFLPEIEGFEFGDSTITSFFLALLGTMSASAGMVTSAAIQRRKLPVIRSNAWGMTYGALCVFLYIQFQGIPFSFDFSPSYVFSLLYLAIFATILGFGCFLTLVGRIGAGKAAYATILFPLLALVISSLLENYQWSLLALTGVALALGGNVVILLDKQKRSA
jgi:drug/metabolite transporter (DMT)-like permease